VGPILATTVERCMARPRAEIEGELPAEEPVRQRGYPSHGQQQVSEEAKDIVEECEGPGWNVAVGIFQMDLVRFGSHGCLRGTELANYEHAHAGRSSP